MATAVVAATLGAQLWLTLEARATLAALTERPATMSVPEAAPVAAAPPPLPAKVSAVAVATIDRQGGLWLVIAPAPDVEEVAGVLHTDDGRALAVVLVRAGSGLYRGRTRAPADRAPLVLVLSLGNESRLIAVTPVLGEEVSGRP